MSVEHLTRLPKAPYALVHRFGLREVNYQECWLRVKYGAVPGRKIRGVWHLTDESLAILAGILKKREDAV